MPKGLTGLLANLNREIDEIKGRSLTGMTKVGVFIKAESQEIVPHRFGVLINSAYSQADKGTGFGPRARIGYTAKYAPYVHEMPESFNFTKPGTGPKFLEKPIAENHGTILSIIAKEAKIK